MNCFIVLLCLVIVPELAWCLECHHCKGTVSQCQPGGNKSSFLECTPPNNRCYVRKVAKIDAEDELHQGCTNEDGCDIFVKACSNSGDCIVSCCEKDRCNSEAGSVASSVRALICLVITAHFGVRLFLSAL